MQTSVVVLEIAVLVWRPLETGSNQSWSLSYTTWSLVLVLDCRSWSRPRPRPIFGNQKLLADALRYLPIYIGPACSMCQSKTVKWTMEDILCWHMLPASCHACQQPRLQLKVFTHSGLFTRPHRIIEETVLSKLVFIKCNKQSVASCNLQFQLLLQILILQILQF